MALNILNVVGPSIGQFDGYDAEVTTFLGGEICSLVSVALGSDKSAADVEFGSETDGYVQVVAQNRRPVVTKVLSSGMRPLFLADDGIAKYGTIFGTVVGGSTGQVVTGGAVLGPHTATGSGKITLWGNTGLYGVTLDAVDTNAGNGLVPTNGNLTVGSAIYATAAGLLTSVNGARFEAVAVGRFVEFMTNGSLVTTPNNLTAALNSPSGNVPVKTAFTQAVFNFSPPAG